MSLYKITIVVLLSFLVSSTCLIFVTQREMVTIQKEQLDLAKDAYLDGVYATYKGNIDTCKEAAKQAKKGQEFIEENCIKPVNDSIVGQALKKWGRNDLLVSVSD